MLIIKLNKIKCSILLIGIPDYVGNSLHLLKKDAALEKSNLYLTYSALNVDHRPLLFHDFSFNYTLPKNSSKFSKYFPKISKKNF